MAGLLALPQPGDVVGGKYLLESVVDRCDVGAVFSARHRQTGRRFALRWLPGTGADPEAAAEHSDLHANGEVVGCFQHPFVLSPVDFGRTRSARYLVMDWLEGETLSSRLKRHPKLSLADTARLLTPCLRGLHEAHLANVIHGELRPGNIFVCSANHQVESLRVFDYSLARPLQPVPLIAANGLQSRHAFYLAPEQIVGGPVDRRSDVYALGVILYRAWTGRLPFSSESSDGFARWVYSQDPPQPSMAAGLTPAMYRLLMRAMAREPEQRFDSCNDLANAIETLARRPGLEELHVAPLSGAGPHKHPSQVATMQLPKISIPPQESAPAPIPKTMQKTMRMPRVMHALGADASESHGVATDDAELGGHEPGSNSRRTVPLRASEPASSTTQRPAVSRPAPERADRDQELASAAAALDPRPYTRPLDRRVLWAAGCFAVVGVIPLAAYYTPPVERPDAKVRDEAAPYQRLAAVAPAPLAAAEPEPSAANPDGVFAPMLVPAVPASVPSDPPPMAATKDDPDTLVDESDPLIAAALASIRRGTLPDVEDLERPVNVPVASSGARSANGQASARPSRPAAAPDPSSKPPAASGKAAAATRTVSKLAASAQPAPAASSRAARLAPAASPAASVSAAQPATAMPVAQVLSVDIHAPAVAQIPEARSAVAPVPPKATGAVPPVKPQPLVSAPVQEQRQPRRDMNLF